MWTIRFETHNVYTQIHIHDDYTSSIPTLTSQSIRSNTNENVAITSREWEKRARQDKERDANAEKDTRRTKEISIKYWIG